ncbi:hypothetical protein ACHMW7_16010 [Aminobacter sp. UC22_36]|uniref:hypothetical protein n=1 Tax=Aminobacter sp. UC22_36 TaxID=3374549 RepID=UPI0037568CF4
MSMKIEDGGPAFPVLYGQTNGLDGMSLRDWFAGQQAAAAMTSANGLGSFSKAERVAAFKIVAEISYEVADALLAARSKSAPAPSPARSA